MTTEPPAEVEAREFWKERGFTEIHRPEFRYKDAARAEAYLLIKKL